ncbi:MAG: ribonuclease III [Paenibacillaceae bacterium]
MNKFQQLQAEVGVNFKDLHLLQQAFTHTSYVNENRQAKHNERLEFLGDAILQLAVTEYLYEQYPNRPEGELSKMRASIVCEPSLNILAEHQNFGTYLLLGRGEESTGGRTRPAILADVFEAFIGALYLDQGFEAVIRFLQSSLFKKLQQDESINITDAKSQLQEYTQQRSLGKPNYHLVMESGPSHEKQFISEVKLQAHVWGTGTGRTKKESEQHAAAQALSKLLAEHKHQ